MFLHSSSSKNFKNIYSVLRASNVEISVIYNLDDDQDQIEI